MSEKMPSIIKMTEKRIRNGLKLTGRNVAASCGEVLDNMAIAFFPKARFNKLNFGHSKRVLAALVEPMPSTMQQQDPHNSHIYRYFNEIPSKRDSNLATSRWNSRLQVDPYSPSNNGNLHPVRIKDLTLGGRNDGVCVVAKVVLEPKHLEAMYVLIEDISGRWDMLHVYDFPYTRHSEDRIGQGQLVIIKEPYYYRGFDGVAAIRIDHATDITYIMHDHPLVPERWKRSDVHGAAVLPKVLRGDGEVRMKWRKYHQAIDCLTLAMKLCDQVPIKNASPKNPTLICKEQVRKLRVGAYFYAGYYELCMEEANAILQSKFDENAGWYKANCSFKMRQYDDAKKMALKVMSSKSKFKFGESSRLLLQIGNHSQQMKGQYRMDHILARCNEGKSDLMAGDYVSGIRVRKSAVHGYGLFATKDFRAGELIFACKAFASIGPDENKPLDVYDMGGNLIKQRYAHKLTAKIIEKMYCEPKSAPLICKVYSGKDPRDVIKDDDGMILVDSFMINSMVDYNAIQYEILTPRIDIDCAAVDPEYFSDEIKDILAEDDNNPDDRLEADQRDASNAGKPVRSNAGFWIPAAFMNHSCVPNTRRSILSDMMFVVASQDIEMGSELFSNYMDDDYGPFEDRRAYIKEKWEFECYCPRCLSEIENVGYWQNRRKIQDAVEAIVFGQISTHIPSQLSGIETCICLLESGRKDNPYDIPQFDMAYCLMAEEYLRRKVEIHHTEPHKSLQDVRYAMHIIKTLGGEFEFDMEDVKFHRHGFVCKWLVEAYILATIGSARFYGPTHWSIRIVAQQVYAILCAEALSFEDILKQRMDASVGHLTEADMMPVQLLYVMLQEYGLLKTDLV